MNLRVAVAIGVVVLAIGLAGCGSPDVFQDLKDNPNGSDTTVPPERASFAALMPGAGGSEAVVIGQIVSVDAGRSFRWDLGGSGEEIRIEEPFNGPEAMTSTIHATLAVNEVIDASPDWIAGTTSTGLVRFGLDFDAPVDTVAYASQLETLDEVVVFLARRSLYDYEPGIYGVVLDGALLGIVDHDGHIEFPAYELPSAYGAPPASIDELRAMMP